jgi:hypothetical protein
MGVVVLAMHANHKEQRFAIRVQLAGRDARSRKTSPGSFCAEKPRLPVG